MNMDIRILEGLNDHNVIFKLNLKYVYIIY
jgi:hypothetical protein